MTKPLRRRFHDLSDALGDAHDLAVLGASLRDDAGSVEDERMRPALALVEARRRDVEQRSLGLPRRLYAESPKRFAKRLGSYWDAWREHGEEPDVGARGPGRGLRG